MRAETRHQIFAIAASAVLQALIFPSPDLPVLSWLAFIPMLWALCRSGVWPGRGFLLGYAAGASWYALTCFWVFHSMHTYGGVSTAAAAGVVILFCLYLALYHGLFGMLVAFAARQRSPGFALALSPFLWVAAEISRHHISGFAWNPLGSALVENLAINPVAKVTGVYGLSFLILAVNAVAVALILRAPRMGGAVALLLAAVLNAGGSYRPAAIPATHTAVLVQQNLPILNRAWNADFYDRTLFELSDLTRSVTLMDTPEPRLVVWPESPAPFYTSDPKFRAWMQALAQDRQAYVIVGSLGTEGAGTPVFNSAALVTPAGTLAARYDKIHLVPFGEYVPFERLLFFAKSLVQEVSHFARGRERQPLAVGGHPAGTFICYEAAFPDEVRQFAAHGAEVFVNISNDGWFGDYSAPGQHLNMARMRAIENGRWVLRATNSGITAVIDPRGRVMARADRNVRTALAARYAFTTVTTFYTRHGDWFPWSAMAIALAGLAFALVRRKLPPPRVVSW